MSTFAKSLYSGSKYLNFRPAYPQSFFDHIEKYTGHVGLAVDVGCGPGTATAEIAKFADKVVGLEPGSSMVETAQKQNPGPNIEYVQGTDDELTRVFEEDTVDLVTVAQAIHWFKFPKFWQEAHRILKPNGKLVFWGYVDCHVVGHPKARELLLKYSYDKEYMGNYWDPGRSLLGNLYRDLQLPNDFKVDERVALPGDTEGYENHALVLEKHCTVEDLLHYVGTYSSYFNWKEANPDKPDVIAEFAAELETIGLPANKEILVRWDTAYVFAHKV